MTKLSPIDALPDAATVATMRADLAAAMTQQIPDLWERVESGDFAPILGWLRTKIHSRGKLLDEAAVAAFLQQWTDSGVEVTPELRAHVEADFQTNSAIFEQSATVFRQAGMEVVEFPAAELPGSPDVPVSYTHLTLPTSDLV